MKQLNIIDGNGTLGELKGFHLTGDFKSMCMKRAFVCFLPRNVGFMQCPNDQGSEMKINGSKTIPEVMSP